MDTIRRVFRKSEATDDVLAAADREVAKVFGASADRQSRVDGDFVKVAWTATLQQKLAAETRRIQSAQVIAKALNERTMSVTGAIHAGQSLRQMLEERKSKLAAAHDKFAANMGKLDEATAALDSLSNDVATEAADLLASIGQFKNGLGGENGQA